MKMKLVKLGAERFNKDTCGFYVKLTAKDGDAEILGYVVKATGHQGLRGLPPAVRAAVFQEML